MYYFLCLFLDFELVQWTKLSFLFIFFMDVLWVICRRSISNFYSGKSKSFTSLADAVSCSSIKDIVKPENAYTRKCKNLLAFSNIWDKDRTSIQRSNSGGIAKRHSNSRSLVALAGLWVVLKAILIVTILFHICCLLKPVFLLYHLKWEDHQMILLHHLPNRCFLHGGLSLCLICKVQLQVQVSLV